MTILDFFKTVHPSVLAAKMIFKYLQEHHPILKISDIADTTSGGTPNRGMVEYYDGNIPWIKSGELKDGLITNCDENITEAGLKNSSAKLFPKGTLLVAMYGANIGKTGVLNFEASTNQAVCAIFPKVNISNDFLFWYFKQQRIDFIAIGKGGAQPNISQTAINNASIVVPDEKIQQKIVEFLNAIEQGKGIDKDFFIPDVLPDIERIYKYKNSYIALTESFETQLTQLENLNQAILQEAVQGKLVHQDPNDEPACELLKHIKAEKETLRQAQGKGKKEKPLPPIKPEEIPFEIPESWVWCRLGEICQQITDGEHLTPPRIKSGRMLLSAKNVRDGYFDFENVDFISEENYQKSIQRCKPEKNDVLIVSVGATIGRSAILQEDFEFALVRSVALVKPFIKTMSNYFKFIFDSPLLQKEISSRSWGTAQPCLYLNQIKELTIPLPPLAEQTRIVAEIEKQLDKSKQLKEHIIANQQATEQLLKALLHETFVVEETKVESEKTEAKIIEFKPKKCSSAEKAILAGHIINLTNNEDFGRVKFQKLLFLAEYHCNLNLESNYVQKAAGPHDADLIEEVESTLKRFRFYDIQQSNIGNHKVNYTALSAAAELDSLFVQNFESEYVVIDGLLAKFKNSTWEQCEIVATLYAVWNNRIVRKELITDELLKQDFLNWDKQKIKYKDRLDGALDWMRRKEIVPNGRGNYIDKPQNSKKNTLKLSL